MAAVLDAKDFLRPRVLPWPRSFFQGNEEIAVPRTTRSVIHPSVVLVMLFCIEASPINARYPSVTAAAVICVTFWNTLLKIN